MAFRQLPTAARRIGFQIEPPSEVEIHPGDIVRCSEQQNGEMVGVLEVSVFHAALVIDRDGILAEKVQQALESAAEPGARVSRTAPVKLAGASGYRAQLELVRPMGTPRPTLPFVYVFAVAPNDLALDGGLVLVVRSASPKWPAADAILNSLRILSRNGGSANDSDATPVAFPLITDPES